MLLTAVVLCAAAATLGVSSELELLSLVTVAEVWLGSLATLLPVWLGAWGLGSLAMLLSRRSGHDATPPQPILVELAVGVGLLLGLAWLLGHAGWLTWPVAWLLCVLPGLFQVGLLARRWHRKRRQLMQDDSATPLVVHLPWTLPLLGVPVGLMLVAAACPPGTLWAVEAFAYDVTIYHLQAPLEWQQLGAIRGLEHNVYSFMPLLLEAGYLMLGVMRGSVRNAVFDAQVFHTTLGLLAAGAVGQVVARVSSAAVGVVAAAAVLSTGWVLITATLAYNEMGVLAMGAAALLILTGPAGTTRRGVAWAGFLCGIAALCKLTAGVMIALPLGLLVLLQLNQATRWRPLTGGGKALRLAAVMAAAGLVTLSPFLIRNAAWTGNPVFPVAATALGHGHWPDELAQRWDAAHSSPLVEAGPLKTLARQWLMNSGYGAIGGYETPRRAVDVARFDREYGLPLFMLAAGACLIAAARSRATRRLAVALAGVLALQVAGWFALTHMQSRFLVPTVLPLAIIFGLGVAALHAPLARRRLGWLVMTAAALLLVFMQLTLIGITLGQTRTYRNDAGHLVHLEPNQIVGQLPGPADIHAYAATGQARVPFGHHLLNHATQPHHKTLLIADASGLLWVRTPFAYQTPFDVNLLGELVRARHAGGPTVTQALQQQGFTHVWVHWRELERLQNSYGFDPQVTRDLLQNLEKNHGWTAQMQLGQSITLYRLPPPENRDGPATGPPE